MLTEDLGYRAPLPEEDLAIRTMIAGDGNVTATLAAAALPAVVLHPDPLISYSSMTPQMPLGLASVIGRRLGDRPAWFLLSPTWTLEKEGTAGQLRVAAVQHRAQHPRHKLMFVCNTSEEVERLRGVGEAAFFYNKAANVSEHVFAPLDGVPVEFDAVYNAQLVPWKRHELSLGVESCAFLFYRDQYRPDAAASEAAILARHAAVAGHVFINRFDANKVPIRFSRRVVNLHLNRAGVGLCLSNEEGAMFASMEYLLSGLPIVSTPSIGGRDVYFDEEFCLVVPPDPRSVAEAVHVLKAKAIPRAYVRERTLQRLERDRARFLGLLNAILEESASDTRFSMPWPFRKQVVLEWLPRDEAMYRAVHGIVDGFEKVKRRKGFLLWRKWLPWLRARSGRLLPGRRG